MARRSCAFSQLGNRSVTADNPAGYIAWRGVRGYFEIRVREQILHDNDAVHKRIGVGVAGAQISEPQRRDRAVCDEAVVVVLEYNRVRIERAGLWRGDRLVQ